MRIAISAAFVRPGRVGGAENALYNLVRGFSDIARASDGWEVLTQRPLALDFDPAPVRVVAAPPTTGNRFVAEMRWAARRDDVDGWLFPNYFTPYRVRGRVVTVIHDAQYRHFPDNFSRRKRLWLAHAHRHTLRRADVVVAISQAVRDDLARHHGPRATGRVVVIPNAVDFERFASTGRPKTLPGEFPYLLCVSAQWRHKNLPTLVRACEQVFRRHDDVHLVVVGQDPDRLIGARRADDVREVARSLGIADRVHVTGYTGDEELGRLYQHAVAAVTPSLFEGFGLPVVEALGLGVPVVASDIPPLREVSLGLARLVPRPREASGWVDALDTVITAPEQFRPSPDDRQRVRDRYAPAAVAHDYAEMLGVDTRQVQEGRA